MENIILRISYFEYIYCGRFEIQKNVNTKQYTHTYHILGYKEDGVQTVNTIFQLKYILNIFKPLNILSYDLHSIIGIYNNTFYQSLFMGILIIVNRIKK